MDRTRNRDDFASIFTLEQQDINVGSFDHLLADFEEYLPLEESFKRCLNDWYLFQT